LTENKE